MKGKVPNLLAVVCITLAMTTSVFAAADSRIEHEGAAHWYNNNVDASRTNNSWSGQNSDKPLRIVQETVYNADRVSDSMEKPASNQWPASHADRWRGENNQGAIEKIRVNSSGERPSDLQSKWIRDNSVTTRHPWSSEDYPDRLRPGSSVGEGWAVGHENDLHRRTLKEFDHRGSHEIDGLGPETVPEPSSILVVISGFVAIAGYKRFKK